MQVKVPPTLRFVMDGQMPHYLLAKDLILQIIGEITVAGAGVVIAAIQASSAAEPVGVTQRVHAALHPSSLKFRMTSALLHQVCQRHRGARACWQLHCSMQGQPSAGSC